MARGSVAMVRRTTLVAGVGPSLGTAIAEVLAHEGHDLVLVGRDRDHVEGAAVTVREAGREAHPVTAELSDGAWLAGLESLPPIDCVVWVASAYAPFASVGRTSVEDFDRVHATALRAPYLLARWAVPRMQRRGWGRWLAVGSVVGSRGGPGQAAYASAKAGLVGLTRTLAAEAGPRGVTANVLELGWIDTDRTRSFGAEAREAAIARTAVRRAGTCGEVAAVVAFLLSDAAAYLTGAVIPLDGGSGSP